MAGKSWSDDAMSPPGRTSELLVPRWPPRAAWHGASREPAKQPDELFEELDGSELVAGGETWRVHVFAVVDEDRGRWIQLGLAGPRQQLATLQLPSAGGTTHVSLAVNEWFEAQRVTDLA